MTRTKWDIYLVLVGIFNIVMWYGEPGTWAVFAVILGALCVLFGIIDTLIEHRKYLRPRWKVESRGWDIKRPDEVYVDWGGSMTFWTRRGAESGARRLLREMNYTSQRYYWETRVVDQFIPQVVGIFVPR